ncbi:glycosyltransferase family 2 protein, partial [Chloroflexi bacterium TSY]|nr:glycosyltransferase family 2 protein [Chloroflexi bacterium TSY]
MNRDHSAHKNQSNSIDLSIILVSWNVWDLLRACLTSIERASRAKKVSDSRSASSVRLFGPEDRAATLEVIVVDNGSNDATVDFVPSLFPWVRFVENQTNLGFTAGNNCGFANSHGRFVYFLNPDTELADGSLWQLYAELRDEPTIGIMGPRLLYPNGMQQNSRRRFPKRLTGFWESTWLGQLWPNNPWAIQMHMLNWPDSIRHDVDWLVGAAIMARRDALDAASQDLDVGPFDETFFMYSEELDLCQRVKQAGWRVAYTPNAVVTHYEGRSSEQVPARRHIYFNTSKVRYYRKYFGSSWAETLRWYLLFEF